MPSLHSSAVPLRKLKINHVLQASVSITDNLGRQAIHQAAQAGADNSVRFLVEECGVDPGVRSTGQEITPLHMAAKVRLC